MTSHKSSHRINQQDPEGAEKSIPAGHELAESVADRRSSSLVCLRFVFLLAARMLAAARLSRRDGAWRTPEILLLSRCLILIEVSMVRPAERRRGEDTGVLSRLKGSGPGVGL